MKIVDNILNVIEGERFTQRVGGIDYDQNSQIVIKIYNERDHSICKYWVKTPHADYPDAGIISKTEDPVMKISFFINTDGLPTGNYKVLAKCVVDGINAPIMKQKSLIFIITPE